MIEFMLLLGAILLICVFMNRIAEGLPLPSLVLFLFLGMLFGVNGIFRIPFDDYAGSEVICSVCLIFIMFYGGFGTNIQQARRVLAPSILLSTLGVVLTAGLIGLFVYMVFDFTLIQSFLVGSVLCSTDAASVFNVLRSKHLALKNNTDSLLEIESGSNDPFSYMLTFLFTALCLQENINVPLLVFEQLFFGIIVGLALGWGMVYLLNHMQTISSAERTILLFVASLLSYAIAVALQGNGYLSVYFCGIFMGNHYLPDKRDMVHFFDVLTENCQMILFFLLGLLCTPVELLGALIPAILISLFMILLARPIVCFLLLKPFRFSTKRIAVISFAGLRGVASVVFAIYTVTQGVDFSTSLFNIVFVVVLCSLIIQGTLLPWVSKKFGMIDPHADVLRTFNDYQEESDISFIRLHIQEDHPYVGKKLKDINFPSEMLAVLVMNDNETTMPNGETILQSGDDLVLAAPEFEDTQNFTMIETYVDSNHRWCNHTIREIPASKDLLIVMIRRKKEIIVPNGDTMIYPKDRVVLLKRNQ